MPLSQRDRRALLIGGAVVVLLLLYLLTRGTGSEPASVELVQPQAPVAAPPPPVAVAPPPAAPTADVSQLKLYGVMGSGAVIGMPDGSQRFVAIGRDVVPGVTLRRVELHHAILAAGAGEIRLGFDGVAQPQAAPGAPAAPAAAPAEAAQREETTRLRLGLAPRQVNGRISGYTMRPGASLPALSRAGIQPGDVILSVNGSELDPERLEGLAWQMANSGRIEFEVERGGRRQLLAVEGRGQ